MSEPSDDPTELLPPSCDPAGELSDATLVQVLLESYARSFWNSESEIQHNRWVECKAEVLSRLARVEISSILSEVITVQLSERSVRLLDELAETGIYGRNKADVAGRFIDQALQRLIETSMLRIGRKFPQKSTRPNSPQP